MQIRSRSHLILTTTLAAVTLAAGCSSESARQGRTFHMGEKVQAGPLIYTVVDTQWRSQLGEPENPRVPTNRFLLVKLSVTNSGGLSEAIPALVLEDIAGQTHPELTEAPGLERWFGALRRITPAQTQDGYVVFDVPTGAYKLQLTDDTDLANPVIHSVELPPNLD